MSDKRNYLDCEDDYLNCNDDYISCGDDYIDCGDDYINCNDDVVQPAPVPPVVVPPYQPPRKDNWFMEIYYKLVVFFNRLFSRR
jgi:hypothetical protein